MTEELRDVHPQWDDDHVPKYRVRVEKQDGTKIPDDEPLFIIRAQDSLSGDIVREYAQMYFTATEDEEAYEGILDHARHMDEWPIKKMPS